MAKAIIEGVLYDTNRAKRLCKYFTHYQRGWEYFGTLQKWSKKTALYLTRSGVYFTCIEDKEIEPIDEKEAREILKKIDPKKYIKVFDRSIKRA